ncbi:hypothetical protein [Flexivirga sp.]|uniref:hypothetical protein n=1 Tax=Flexivirga sp. TaxID=1962927 RepID=UPI003F7FC76A
MARRPVLEPGFHQADPVRRPGAEDHTEDQQHNADNCGGTRGLTERSNHKQDNTDNDASSGPEPAVPQLAQLGSFLVA